MLFICGYSVDKLSIDNLKLIDFVGNKYVDNLWIIHGFIDLFCSSDIDDFVAFLNHFICVFINTNITYF